MLSLIRRKTLCIPGPCVCAAHTVAHSLSSTREMVLSFNFVRICPQEIIQDVGDRENSERKGKSFALLFSEKLETT